jgi:hypothetical protein
VLGSRKFTGLRGPHHRSTSGDLQRCGRHRAPGCYHVLGGLRRTGWRVVEVIACRLWRKDGGCVGSTERSARARRFQSLPRRPPDPTARAGPEIRRSAVHDEAVGSKLDERSVVERGHDGLQVGFDEGQQVVVGDVPVVTMSSRRGARLRRWLSRRSRPWSPRSGLRRRPEQRARCRECGCPWAVQWCGCCRAQHP